MTTKKEIYVLGGGTSFHIRPHLALSAPAYGQTSDLIFSRLSCVPGIYQEYNLVLGKTKMAMAGKSGMTNGVCIGETNSEVEEWIDTNIISNPQAKMVFLSVAFCDFDACVVDDSGTQTKSGKQELRLKTREGNANLLLTPAKKIIGKIRKQRKDIFLVGFKTTTGASEEEQYRAGLKLLKENSCNLVIANDLHTRLNMIIAPELAKYGVTTNRHEMLDELVEIAYKRNKNKFTQTTVENTGELLGWDSKEVPANLVEVVDWCVSNNAYKPFNNITVGHFGFKPEQGIMWSSRRKRNFNYKSDRDLVKVDFSVEGKQIAYGAKPSAGARSQYMVLSKFPEMNCIVHFHCPLKDNSVLGSLGAVRSQKYVECGSHQCGQNTANGMVKISSDIAAVMLDKHGPNIVFSQKADPKEVVKFISENFELNKQTE